MGDQVVALENLRLVLNLALHVPVLADGTPPQTA
jgi:hypothetical protein